MQTTTKKKEEVKKNAYELFGTKNHVHKVHVLVGAVLTAFDDQNSIARLVDERKLALDAIYVA